MRAALDVDTDVNWRRRGLCRHEPDLWAAKRRELRVQAAHICRAHCPVLAQCADAMQSTPADRMIGMVVAGVIHGDEGNVIITSRLLLPARCRHC